MVNWTEEQRKAITTDDKNMIVSAAAGSGKTAVLVERIKRLVIEKRTGIDKFLIVTFTKAAASEMKEKLIKAINEEIRRNPATSKFMRDQLNLISTANISTFHAFAMEVIRRYFYLTDLEPNFKIGDEGTVEIIRREVLDQLFQDYFESESQEFLEFLRCYGSDRNEKALKETFLKFYNTIQSIPHPMGWLEAHTRELSKSKEEFFDSSSGKAIKDMLLKDTADAVKWFRIAMETAEFTEDQKSFQKLQQYYEDLRVLPEYIGQNQLDRARELVVNYDFGRLTVSKKVDEETKQEIVSARDKGKALLAGLKEGFLAQPVDVFMEDFRAVYPHACFLERMTKDFHQCFRKAKKKKNLIDFNDIEHYALEILENETAAAEYREKFQYIFVDEYQDSNVMQDTLINLIKKENNLFVVGDIKQSIYKFRLAEPEIFQARYEAYADEEDSDSIKLDLNCNFRSKGQVIKTVNDVFQELMPGYDSAAALKQGDPYHGELDFPTELYVIDSRATDEMELDDELKEMKDAELEAHCAAAAIKDLVGTTIYDSKKGCQRPVTLKDIVILMRSTKSSAEIFQQVFRDQDIPVYVDDSAGYFDTVEIQVFMNLLSIIDNKQQDIPLLSVLYSAVFGFSVEDLIKIRLERPRGTYYDALKQYAEQGTEPELSGRCREVFDKLNLYRQMAQALPLEEFVWKLMWETGYYTYCGALPAGQQRQANLKALADKARAFKETGYGGIYGFLTYIRAIEKREVKTGQVKLINENDDMVRIMTIHKSKGLEFPVVLVAGLGKKLRHSGGSGKFFAHKDFGIGMTRVEYKEHWSRKTLLQMVMERKIQQEELDENIRILYVALTRAKDRLILMGTKKDPDREIKTKQSFLDYLLSLPDSCIFHKRIDRQFVSLSEQGKSQEREQVRHLISSIPKPEKSSEYQELDRKLSFRYPNLAALSKKSKYSVTEYSKAGTVFENRREELKTPAFMRTESEISAARKGTVMHKVMEVIDFKAAYDAVISGDGDSYVEQQVLAMLRQEMITEEEAGFIEPDKILNFFRTDLGARAAAASDLQKEAEFNYIKESDGVEVMVQGVIDCFFEEDGRYVLIDYKNSYVNPENREAALKKLAETYTVQVELYKEALELIKGKPVAETYLYLFSEGEFLNIERKDSYDSDKIR